VEQCLVLEELAAGDAGLAASLLIAPMAFQYAANFGSPQVVADIAMPFFGGDRPDWQGCFAITDTNHGSDMMAAHLSATTVRGGDLSARRNGRGWVLDGQKSAWVSCASTATHALVCCALDAEDLARSGIAIVPLDLDGVSRAAPVEKLGVRPMNQAQLTFTDVRIPADYMIVGADTYAPVMRVTQVLASASFALLALGIGRAAYEGATRFAGERVQGGKLLREHQAVQLRLFRMFSLLEAARSLARTVYAYNYGAIGNRLTGSLAHSCASKVFVTDATFEICDLAVQICGARGMLRNGVQFADGTSFYPEKLLRDAKAFKIADSENGFLALTGAAEIGRQ